MKRFVCFLLAVCVLLSAFSVFASALTPSPEETVSPYGDVDFDNYITAGDARLVLRASVGLETFDDFTAYIADVDFDSVVSAGDARLILRISVGLESPYIVDPYHKCNFRQGDYYCTECRSVEPKLFAPFVNNWIIKKIHTQQDGLYYYNFGEGNVVYTIMTDNGSPLEMFFACSYVDENNIVYSTLINIHYITGEDSGVFMCYDALSEEMYAQGEFIYNKTTFERNDILPFTTYEGNSGLQSGFEKLAGEQLSEVLIAVKTLFEAEYYRLTPETMLFPAFDFDE